MLKKLNFIKNSLSIGLFLCLNVSCFSQKKILTQEIQLESYNDNYILSFDSDSYYTNGLVIRYRSTKDYKCWSRYLLDKVVRSYEINHQMFTPQQLIWSNYEDFDRPYAGLLSFSGANEYFYKNKSYLKVRISVGWVGPVLKTGAIQTKFHEIANAQPPLGWKYEINNGPVLNSYATYSRNIASFGNFDATSETNLALGTTFNFIRQELLLRAGRFKPIQISSHYGGLLGIENHQLGIKEFYFFMSPGIEYVIYNATIQGHWIGEESIHTEDRVPWIFQGKIGFMASWTRYDLALIYHFRTNETTESSSHDFVGIRLVLRY